MGEAWGKLGEASYFLGKHTFYPLKNCEKIGEAIEPSTLFIILKGEILLKGENWERGGGEGCTRYVAEGSLLEFYHQWAGSFARQDTMSSSVCSGGLGVIP